MSSTKSTRVHLFIMLETDILPDGKLPLREEAITNKVKLVINTDSQDVTQMDLLQYGVTVVRRGWATVDDILNAKSYNSVKTWFQS